MYLYNYISERPISRRRDANPRSVCAGLAPDAGRQLRQRGGLRALRLSQHGVEMVEAIISEQQQLALSCLSG